MGTRAGPNKNELCSALGFDANDTYLCGPQHLYELNDGELNWLLEKRFPLELTTRAEVNQILGIYLVQSSRSSSDGYHDRYAIVRTLIPSWPVIAYFAFDKTGMLTSILIVD